MFGDLNGDPPHVLVIEYVDPYDVDQSMLHVECPFPTVERFWLEEYGGRTLPPAHGSPDDEWVEMMVSTQREEIHLEHHYCTMGGIDSREGLVPAWTIYSRWKPESYGHGEVCAKIELGARAAVFGGCYYAELISSVGLFEAFGGGGYGLGVWPSYLPREEGRYPVYHWSEGGGEDYDEGLSLERDPLGDDLIEPKYVT